jgi:hypothetical protein
MVKTGIGCRKAFIPDPLSPSLPPSLPPLGGVQGGQQGCPGHGAVLAAVACLWLAPRGRGFCLWRGAHDGGVACAGGTPDDPVHVREGGREGQREGGREGGREGEREVVRWVGAWMRATGLNTPPGC